jgi:hypothetical protein
LSVKDTLRGGKQHNKCRGHPRKSKAKMVAKTTTTTYHNRVLKDIKRAVEAIKDGVREHRSVTPNVQVDEKKLEWISDTSFSRSSDTKLLKIVEIY